MKAPFILDAPIDPFIFPAETTYSILARCVGAKLDEAIKKAINNHLGREDWTIREVYPRLALRTMAASNVQILTMDEEPIFSLAPVETNIEHRDLSSFACAICKFDILNEKEPQT